MEHKVAIVSFTGALKREIKRIRNELRKCENLPSFRLDIEVTGRVHDGDTKLAFCIGEYYSSTDTVKGDDLQPVLDEFLRRHGWSQVHAPKAIGYERIPGDDTDD